MRLILPALLAKESAHGYELKRVLEQTFGSAGPSPRVARIDVTPGRRRRVGVGVTHVLSEPGHAGEGENLVASPLVEGAHLHLRTDLEWPERCQEALT